MKTTNNKLLDNTGNPVSHNRPIWNVDKCNCNIYSEKCDYCYSFPNELENYIDKLEKENQELKDQLHMLKALDVENRKLIQENFNKFMEKQFDYENQFLKVVESVLKEHWLTNNEVNCSCKEIYNTQHLLQEIKSAMEKGNNNG